MKKLVFLELLFVVFLTFTGCASLSESQKEELLKDNCFLAIHKTKVDKTRTGFSWFSYGFLFLYIPHYNGDLRTLSVKFQNLSRDAVSEISFSVMPRDKNGGIAGSTTDGKTEAVVTYKNTIGPGKTKTAVWTGVWLNKNIVYVTVDGVEIKYSNGNAVRYGKEQIRKMLAGAAGNPRIKANGDNGVYMNFGVLYNYSKLTPDPVIESRGAGLSFGIGADFGRITLGVDADADLLSAVAYTGYGYGSPLSIDGYVNAGFRLGSGIKLYDGKIFDFIVPLGVMWRINKLEVTHDGGKKFEYAYLAAESGVVLSWRLSDSLYLQIPARIGYPFWKKHVYSNYYSNKEFDVLAYSAGLNFKWLF